MFPTGMSPTRRAAVADRRPSAMRSGQCSSENTAIRNSAIATTNSRARSPNSIVAPFEGRSAIRRTERQPCLSGHPRDVRPRDVARPGAPEQLQPGLDLGAEELEHVGSALLAR